MTTFLGTDIEPTIRQIINDASSVAITGPQMLVNINAGIRAVLRDAPASRYSSHVAFRDNADITALSDAINLDIRYRDAVIHYAASRCFDDDDRHTNNTERGTAEYNKYKDSLY